MLVRLYLLFVHIFHRNHRCILHYLRRDWLDVGIKGCIVGFAVYVVFPIVAFCTFSTKVADCCRSYSACGILDSLCMHRNESGSAGEYSYDD